MVKELEMLEEEKEESKDQQFKLIETMIEQDTLLEPDDDYYKQMRAIPVATQLLQQFKGRRNDIYESREEAAHKIFHYAIFKLAVIFERVRLYE